MQITTECEILSILLMADYDDMIIPQLEVGYFASRENATIFKACQQLFYKKHKIEPTTVIDFLTKNNALTENIGTKIKQCIDDYVSGVNYQYYINELIEAFRARLVSTIKTPQDFEKVEEQLKGINSTAKIVNIGYKATDLIMNYYSDDIKRIKTGFKKLDESIGCFMNGDYVILAAATGVGKTFAMLNLVKNIAKQGNRIAVFSLEMSLQQIQNRFACLDMGFDSSKYRKFNFETSEIHNYCKYVEEIMPKYDIDIICEYDINIDSIKSIIKRGNYDIVFIDYLGLISGKGTAYEKFSEISRSIKQIALEDNICMVCLHQINRAYADRQDKRPRASDLRDSGKLEQDADSIILLHKPSYFDPKEDNELLEVIIEKNRHGKGKTIITYKMDSISQQMMEN